MTGPVVPEPNIPPSNASSTSPERSSATSVAVSNGNSLSSLRSAPQPVPETFDFRSFALFAEITEEQRHALARASTLVCVRARALLGSNKGNTLVVVSGEVECLLSDAANKPFLLSVQSRGASLGELSFLVPESAQDEKVTLRAQSDVTALVIPNEVLQGIISHNSHAAMVLLRQIAERLKHMNAFAKTAVDVNIDPDSVEPETLSDRAAGRLMRGLGSWSFVGGSMIFIGAWMGVNALPGVKFDSPPYVGLNLVFSLMSALTGSIILIAQNYQNKLDSSVVKVIQRVTIGIASKVDQLIKNQSKTNRRLEAIEAQLEELTQSKQSPDSKA